MKIDFQHIAAVTHRFWMPEIASGGVALIDYDGDGFLDVYFVQGGELVATAPDHPANRMYRNLGDGTFEDVTDSTGTGDTSYGMGAACGDYDGDGDVDLYITNVGPNVLYRNNGDGTFTDVTEAAGVGDAGWGSSAAFVDYNGDGLLDLFVVNYLDWSPSSEKECWSSLDERVYCGPNAYDAPARDVLLRNVGNGRFVDVSKSVGLNRTFGNGLGVAPGDFNGDGRWDFYVANDGTPNQLWMGQGADRFKDEAPTLGCALNHHGTAEAGMGVAAVDINQDGRLDLFMSHLRGETNTFYLNRGTWFDDVTPTLGLGASSTSYTGFGLGFADFDHDSNLDLFIVNGRVIRVRPYDDPKRPYDEENLLYAGDSSGSFREVLPRGGVNPPLVRTSRGAAFGDLDNDGDIDVVVVNRDARVHVLRNVIGAQGNWVMFRVLDARGCYAIGARVEIATGSRRRYAIVQRAYSYCASNDPRVHFGLGRSPRVDEITVRWQDGHTEKFGPAAAGQLYDLRRGSGKATPTQ